MAPPDTATLLQDLEALRARLAAWLCANENSAANILSRAMETSDPAAREDILKHLENRARFRAASKGIGNALRVRPPQIAETETADIILDQLREDYSKGNAVNDRDAGRPEVRQ